MPKRILVVLSEFGYWGEELLGPLEMFDAQGYQVDFVTNHGRRPRALPPSADSMYIDPPLGRSVTHEDSVIVDYPFVTGRSNHDSYMTGQNLVEVLET